MNALPSIRGPLLGVLLVILVFVLAGCGKATLPPTREPALAQCDAVCYAPCVKPDGDTGKRWATVVGHDRVDPPPADDPRAWDQLSEITLELADKLRVCDARRDACVQCLNRLEQQRVIVQ